MKEKYRDNPSLFAEEVLGMSLLPCQKEIIDVFIKNRRINAHYPIRNGRQMVAEAIFEYMKAMQMDFMLARPEVIEVYEKGQFVKTIKRGEVV